ncbi:hypothetical protein VOLCADRAFT_108180 [Volvox carteri f. nagariensis]|uniref:Uncharacterized protein n=1 Tax=Volvox carteri f. nagariensis TaxID=3068 RepID=D8UIS5_VOLCA|nr:uncharacterized protein VOLCADRAFT_108180 [Volvox carteri f. nagariensis]EFJ40356.1 hypothetical protein VOLCADRAFT_108180 [Volvox carteri f. nagariensis]|eukprot:XP_002958560.1 hypothetical protein VOLCADRAFT_108180 [Volvox carteri f. nagariensis]
MYMRAYRGHVQTRRTLHSAALQGENVLTCDNIHLRPRYAEALSSRRLKLQPSWTICQGMEPFLNTSPLRMQVKRYGMACYIKLSPCLWMSALPQYDSQVSPRRSGITTTEILTLALKQHCTQSMSEVQDTSPQCGRYNTFIHFGP